MPFSCRIRCTTARCSDFGATRRATSQTVSPAPTRVTAVAVGIAGCVSDPVQSRPPTTANITMADATRPDRNDTGGALPASATAGASSRAGHAASRRRRAGAAAGTGAGRVGRGRARARGRLGLASVGTPFPPHVPGRLLNCADAGIETPHSGSAGPSLPSDVAEAPHRSMRKVPARRVGVNVRPAGSVPAGR
jgi:hypothetical protein